MGKVDRRSVLRFAAVAGGSSAILSTSSSVSASEATGSVPDESNVDSISLGNFESGLDGWKTDGGNDLQRATDEDFPVAVTSGEHALDVGVNGDLFPAVRKNVVAEDISFVDYPYLRANVLGIAEETDSDILFQFRLQYSSSNGNGNGNSNENGKAAVDQGALGSASGPPQRVIESAIVRVRQANPEVLQWDLSDIEVDTLEAVRHVELAWYLADHEPDGGPRGKATGEVEYHGRTFVDDVRLLESDPDTTQDKQQRKKMELHREHGMIVDKDIETQTLEIENGTFIYSDGTEISYEYQVLESGGYRYTVDGETFEIGGDSE